jgi:Response regulator containing CheY-like receiver, AAA-type ATPase, and DNA-binding domains
MNKQVIVLEDDREIREMVEYILSEEHLEVRSFEKVEKFWKAIDSIHSDLFLLDIMLPDGNGLEVCKQLRLQKKTQHIPIIIMSAHFSAVEGECNPADFIRKPFDVDDFIGTIHRIIA